MHIEDIIDCRDCESYKVVSGRTWGDPDKCYPAETLCAEGASVSSPCDRMRGAVNDLILDGQLGDLLGYFIDAAWAKQVQQGDAGCDVEPWFMEFDFSSSAFWFIPYEEGKSPIPYKDEIALIRDWFD